MEIEAITKLGFADLLGTPLGQSSPRAASIQAITGSGTLGSSARLSDGAFGTASSRRGGAVFERKRESARPSASKPIEVWKLRILAAAAVVVGFCPVRASAEVETSSVGAGEGLPDPPVPEAEAEAPPRYRNPQGSLSLSGSAGAAVGGESTRFVLGLGVGYAILTGVMPGVRGLLLFGDGLGAELSGTLVLTPPVDWTFTPFVIGEGGRRWEPEFRGWLYGAGGGVYLGEVESSFNVQVGWIFRRFVTDRAEGEGGGSFDVSGPIIALAFRVGG